MRRLVSALLAGLVLASAAFATPGPEEPGTGDTINDQPITCGVWKRPVTPDPTDSGSTVTGT